jgi:hypothetical protein
MNITHCSPRVEKNTHEMTIGECDDVAQRNIGLARHTVRVDGEVRAGQWPKPPGISLADKSVALVGFGYWGKVWKGVLEREPDTTLTHICHRGAPNEGAELRFEDDGSVSLLVGTQSNGMGHETAYAQIAADLLGLPIEAFRYVQADTSKVRAGNGHGGARSMHMGGAALCKAVDAMLAKGVYVIGFSYPVVPQGKARIRVQMSAAHSRQDLELAVEAFKSVKQELGI